ncbi:MAG: hypothetical protein ACHQT8_07515 [Chlamydiales bacterium]
MSSSSQPVQNGHWSNLLTYVTPPVAAAGAIVPVFYGFAAKSAQQLGNPMPRMSPFNALKGGLKVAPTIGATVGMQLIFQRVIENALKKGDQTSKESSFATKFFSSTITGAVSVPLLAVFNGQTMGYKPMQSLRALSIKQGCAVLVRETGFLASVGGEYPFFSGMLGSLVGHPGDTALTRWQKGLKVESFRQAMWGAPARAVAVGGFSVGYKFLQDKLHELADKLTK